MSYIDRLNPHMADPQAANFVPLSPLSFLKRTAHVFGDHTATITTVKNDHGGRFTVDVVRSLMR